MNIDKFKTYENKIDSLSYKIRELESKEALNDKELVNLELLYLQKSYINKLLKRVKK